MLNDQMILRKTPPSVRLFRWQPAAAWLLATCFVTTAAGPAGAAATEKAGSPLTVLAPKVTTTPAPLQPQIWPDTDRSVILDHSPFMINKNARPNQPYSPIETGGFRITGGRRDFCRHINSGHNILVTGDTPRFRVTTSTGSGCYLNDNRTFPLFDRPDAAQGGVKPSLGELRLGVPQASNATLWLDELTNITTSFYPGYTEYQLSAPDAAWTAVLTIAPAPDFHGFICKIAFDHDTPLRWQYAKLWYKSDEKHTNTVTPAGRQAMLTDTGLPRGEVVVGWNGDSDVLAMSDRAEPMAQATSVRPQRTYYILQTWGVTGYDDAKAKAAMERLDNANTRSWIRSVKSLQTEWFDWMIGRALQPEAHYRQLAANPEAQLQQTLDFWQARRNEFQIRTPDSHLTALINWNRAISEYHHQGPGLLHGTELWAMYSHLSVGWYGKEWGGDHAAADDNLRLYAAAQRDDGYIRWISEAMVPYSAEDNTPYWVDQVWQHYRWTGDKSFLADLWPNVQRAMQYIAKGDPDGDGLYRAWYEYWNCDSNGKGPKAAAPTATAWMAFRAAASIASALQHASQATEYSAVADKIHAAAIRELWRPTANRFGSIGSDGMWRGHSQIWEQYLGINAGLTTPGQSRGALRWLESHLGFQPEPGVNLLMSSDFWPLRWSDQWVVTGDTCLAIQGAMRNGDADLWWPYLRTLVRAPFQPESGGPGIRMAVNNHGCAGGEREDVDSDDPYTQMTVRGLFGVAPNFPERRVDILPGFPAAWTHASIRTPDLSYEYERHGETATFHVTSRRPLVKHIRANFGGEEITTPAETDSTVSLHLAPALPLPAKTDGPQTVRVHKVPLQPYSPLTAAEQSRQVLVDLRAAYNQTLEQLTAKTAFTFDYQDQPSPISSWWNNPKLKLGASPSKIRSSLGVIFSIRGGQTNATEQPDLLALSSWAPYPLPAAATIPIGRRCERIWLLLQNYVHPMRCYVPNGEVVLHYADGTQTITSLVPPYNLDCYYQQFALEGMDMPLGELADTTPGWEFSAEYPARARAQILQIASDPQKNLKAIEVRATCSEGVIGVAGLTLLPPPDVANF